MREILKMLLLIFPLFSYADADDRHSLNGVWYSQEIDQDISIKEKHDALIIAGLNNSCHKDIYWQDTKRVFSNEFGDKIVIDCHNTIFFLPNNERHHQRKIIFIKSDFHSGNKHNDRNHDHDNFKAYRNNDYKDDYYDPYRSGSNDKWSNYSELVNGTWKSNFGYNDNVAITDTRDGIRAKMIGKDNWVDYVRSNTNPNEFIDAKGNKYYFELSGKAAWYPADKNRKVVVLTKINNNF